MPAMRYGPQMKPVSEAAAAVRRQAPPVARPAALTGRLSHEARLATGGILVPPLPGGRATIARRDAVTARPATRSTTAAKPRQALVAPAPLGITRTGGVATFVGRLAVKDSAGIAVGDHCTIRSENHVHIRRVTPDLGVLARPSPRLVRALRRLAADPSHTAARRVQAALPAVRTASTRASREPTRVRLRPEADVSVRECQGVSYGSSTTTRIHTRAEIVEVRLQVAELLKRDVGLVRSLGRSLRDAGAEGRFQADVLRAAGRTDELRLLELARDATGRDTLISSLFGGATVTGATGVVVGRNPRMHTRSSVTTGRTRGTALGAVRRAVPATSTATTTTSPATTATPARTAGSPARRAPAVRASAATRRVATAPGNSRRVTVAGSGVPPAAPAGTAEPARRRSSPRIS